jgi:hypothetical protein
VVAPIITSAVALVVSFAAYREILTALIFASATGLSATCCRVYWFLRWHNLTSVVDQRAVGRFNCDGDGHFHVGR